MDQRGLRRIRGSNAPHRGIQITGSKTRRAQAQFARTCVGECVVAELTGKRLRSHTVRMLASDHLRRQ
jgi:hypothetical protein